MKGKLLKNEKTNYITELIRM